MGRGIIKDNMGAGRYVVELDYGKQIKEDKRRVLLDDSTRMLGEINELEAKRDIEAQKYRDEQVLFNVLINTYSQQFNENPQGDYTQIKAEINESAAKLETIRVSLEAVQTQVNLAKSVYAQIQRDLGTLNAVGVTQQFNTWCVDYSPDAALGTEVATIEIPGEPDAVVIAPGTRAPTNDDGELRARGLLDPNQAYLNAALLPGWQRWKPTYRKATVTGINYDLGTMTVALDNARSSAQRLPVNFDATLSGVPVEYGACGVGAFELGDRVVVQLESQDWANPKVIGFVSNPKKCSFFYFVGISGSTTSQFKIIGQKPSITVLPNIPFIGLGFNGSWSSLTTPNFKFSWSGTTLLQDASSVPIVYSPALPANIEIFGVHSEEKSQIYIGFCGRRSPFTVDGENLATMIYHATLDTNTGIYYATRTYIGANSTEFFTRPVKLFFNSQGSSGLHTFRVTAFDSAFGTFRDLVYTQQVSLKNNIVSITKNDSSHRTISVANTTYNYKEFTNYYVYFQDSLITQYRADLINSLQEVNSSFSHSFTAYSGPNGSIPVSVTGAQLIENNLDTGITSKNVTVQIGPVTISGVSEVTTTFDGAGTFVSSESTHAGVSDISNASTLFVFPNTYPLYYVVRIIRSIVFRSEDLPDGYTRETAPADPLNMIQEPTFPNSAAFTGEFLFQRIHYAVHVRGDQIVGTQVLYVEDPQDAGGSGDVMNFEPASAGPPLNDPSVLYEETATGDPAPAGPDPIIYEASETKNIIRSFAINVKESYLATAHQDQEKLMSVFRYFIGLTLRPPGLDAMPIGYYSESSMEELEEKVLSIMQYETNGVNSLLSRI